MDSGDGVVVHITIPEELDYLIIKYKMSRRIPTKTSAIREIIETHPAIANLAQEVYAASRTIN